MAHKGHPFPFLFQRDFSLRYEDAGFHALAEQYIASTFFWSNGLYTIGGSFIATDQGVASYPNEEVVYRLNPTTSTPAGLKVDLRYRLTHDPLFFKWVLELNAGGVVKYRGEETGQVFTPLHWLPNAICNPVPPQTGPPLTMGFSLFPKPY